MRLSTLVHCVISERSRTEKSNIFLVENLKIVDGKKLSEAAVVHSIALRYLGISSSASRYIKIKFRVRRKLAVIFEPTQR